MSKKHAKQAGNLAFLSPIRRKNKTTKFHVFVHKGK